MIEATLVTFIFDKHKNIWLHRFDHKEAKVEKRPGREEMSTGDRRRHRGDHLISHLGLNEEVDEVMRLKKLSYWKKLELYMFGTQKSPLEDPKVTPHRIDTISKIMFPVTFFLFNCFYWPFVLKERGVKLD